MVKIPKEKAEELRLHLIEKNLFDFNRKVKRNGNFVLLPVKEYLDEYVCIEDENPIFTKRKNPAERIKEICGVYIDSWRKYGDAVVIRIKSNEISNLKKLGYAISKVLNAKCVLLEFGIEGEYREPEVKVIYGECEEIKHIENGITYFFNPTKIMFSPGNVGERIRMGEIDMSGEIVVDMFAGIGYFSLPSAKYGGARKVYSCEKNPEAFRYLCKNIHVNALDERIIPLFGDNREVAPENIADRVIMGYIHTEKFLEKAFRILKRGGGIIHYHDIFHKSVCKTKPIEILKKYAEKYGYRLENYSIRKVKTYSPNLNHMVVDAIFSKV